MEGGKWTNEQMAGLAKAYTAGYWWEGHLGPVCSAWKGLCMFQVSVTNWTLMKE